MIQLIKYNEPTITGRIYQKGCFTNFDNVKDYFILEKPNLDKKYIDSNNVFFKNAIFVSKLEENDSGLFIKDLKFIENEENKNFLSLFDNKRIGISSKSIGLVRNNIVESAEIFGAELILDYKEANSNYDFTFEGSESKLILEFLPLDRYGDEYIYTREL